MIVRLVLLLLLPVLANAATIEGRVMLDGRPLAGMKVAAHRTFDPRTPAVAAAVSDDDGRYRFELPAGRYALFGRSADGKVFAAFGGNQLEIGGDGTQWVGLQAVPASEVQRAPYDDSHSAAIEGTVVLDGKPLAGAVVSLYLDASDGFKGPGYRNSLPTAGDGAFAFDALPEADFYLLARRRVGGGTSGPMVEGDLLAWFSGNPLPARAGEVGRTTLHAVRKVRDGEGENNARGAAGLTLQGVVVDRAGEPVAGLHVFAYTERVIGHKRPAALSAPTGADGRFTLVVPRSGVYYVGARQQYGDSPAPGELFGLYDGSADHGLQVEGTGERPTLRLVVEPISL